MKDESVAHYQIIDKIGEGGMGAVWKARDGKLGRIVALKFLSNVDAPGRERFKLEARAASALNHPGIVTIYEILEHCGRPCIVMEYVEGLPLSGVIPPDGLPAEEVIRLGTQIADALHAAHHAGIVHRDLKPTNVIVTPDGKTKLLDFGLAKLIDEDPADNGGQTLSGTKTAAGMVLGTAHYMSPEQAQGKFVDRRSDVFSLGAMLYEMATGRKAFTGGTTVSTIAAILRDDPEPISAEVAGLPHELDRVVMRCLRKDPERRFQTATDVRSALEDLREESASGRLVGLPIGPQIPTSVPRESASKWLPWAVAALVITLAGVGGWLFTRRAKAVNTTVAAPLTVRPLTSLPGRKQLPIFSRDGNTIAFAWDGGEAGRNSNVYLMQLDGGRPLKVTNHSASEWPGCFSPDGRRLYFQPAIGNRFHVVLGAGSGGDETRVTDGVVTDVFSRWSVRGAGSPERLRTRTAGHLCTGHGNRRRAADRRKLRRHGPEI